MEDIHQIIGEAEDCFNFASEKQFTMNNVLVESDTLAPIIIRLTSVGVDIPSHPGVIKT